MKIKVFSFLLISGLIVPGLSAAAEEPIYGSELMTQQERQEHRSKMQSMSGNEEREEYRMQHHEKMMERAKEKGVRLPERPQSQGRGMNQRQGGGMGSGMGGGMGRQ